MPVFQISSHRVSSIAPPRRRPRPFSSRWYLVVRAFGGGVIGGLLFTVLILFGQSDALFVLLPIFVSLAWAQPQRYNLPRFLRSTPLYLLLTVGLTCLYYGGITEILLFFHQSQASHIILITTTLSWAIICDPVRAYFQKRIEERFNVRDREMQRALQAFTATLRAEIHLKPLCERFIAVIQQTLQPYLCSLWIPLSPEQQKQDSSEGRVVVADDDALTLYLLAHPSVQEVSWLPRMDSPLLNEIQGKFPAVELLLPLTSQGELTGLLILGPHMKGEEYTHEERITLNTLALQVAPALRVARLVLEQQEQALARERIAQELQTAQVIQHTFLPKEIPALPDWRLLPYYQPAREVGGDFYDFLPFARGQLGLVIGDVTGKGIPAALVMATVHTMIRTVVQDTIAPGEVLARVNELLTAEIPGGMFVTCFFLLLDPATGRVRYANAGHELPFHHSKDRVTELWATGMPLGMLPGSKYEENVASLAPGESLFFYSDGLVEAHNTSKEMFGNPRLKTLLSQQHAEDQLIDTALVELRRFTGADWVQEDDVTLVTVHRLAMTSH